MREDSGQAQPSLRFSVLFASRMLLIAWVMSPIAVARAQSEFESSYAWCRSNPDQIGAFAHWLLHRGSTALETRLPPQLLRELGASTPAEQVGFARGLAEHASRRGDFPLADAILWQILSREKDQLSSSGTEPVTAEMKLLRGDARRPRDALVEANYPANVFKARYLAAESGMSRAAWLLDQPNLPKPDRENVQAWHDRMTWILGPDPQVKASARPDLKTVTGTLVCANFPLAFTRIAVMKPRAELLSGGGYRSFLNGLDTIVSKDIPPLPPMEELAWDRTNSTGRFRLQLPAGGPYAIVIVAARRAAGTVKSAVLLPGADSPLRPNEGLTIAPDATSVDLGVLELRLQRESDWNPPLLDVRAFGQSAPVIRGEPITLPVRITNAGSRPLVISRLRTDCGCSAVTPNPQTTTSIALPAELKPDETATWYMTVRTNAAMPLGTNSKSILMATSDPLSPDVRVECRFRLTDLVEWDPPLIRMTLNESSPQIARLKSSRDLAPRIKSVREVRAASLDVAILPDQRSLSIKARPDRSPGNGASAYVELMVELEGTSVFVPPLPVYLRDPDGAGASPASFNFGLVRPGTVIRRSVTILAAPAPLRIKSVTTVHNHARVTKSGVDSQRLEIELECRDGTGDTLRVELDDSSRTTIDVPLKWKLAND